MGASRAQDGVQRLRTETESRNLSNAASVLLFLSSSLLFPPTSLTLVAPHRMQHTVKTQ